MKITDILPHRPPFLFVDQVTDVEPGKWAKGYKNICADEWYFSGHFPNKPIMPGVLIAEAMAQLGACAVYDPNAKTPRGTTLLINMKEAHFSQAVMPGDRLDLFFTVLSHRGPYLKGKTEAKVRGKQVARIDELFLYHQAEEKIEDQQ